MLAMPRRKPEISLEAALRIGEAGMRDHFGGHDGARDNT
jgi:hypothetical protein